MYLKEIRAYGFKSFADKTTITFSKNINGIVGPNGSGKSNVVDAVRFVLGEQSSKTLRGDGSINDMIFTGSKSRKPLTSASVTLIFDNSDHSLPIDFAEVSIKRTVYKTGDNEFYINNEKVRLKDITDLLMDTLASKESFTIIGQGRISEIVSSKAIDRRIIIEEAAGVLKYKKRKEEAIRKLEKTNDNLVRVNDIIKELENNLKPLEEQANSANTYLNIKEELSSLEISLTVAEIEKLNFNYKEAKTRIDLINDELISVNSNNSNNDVDIAISKNKIKEIEDDISLKQNKLLKTSTELEKLNAEIKLLKERSKYNDKDEYKNKIIVLKENNLQIDKDINNINNDLKIKSKELDNINNNINNLVSSYKEIKDKINKLNNEINKNNRSENDLKYKIEYLENLINNNSNLPNSVANILNNPKFTSVHNIIGKLIDMDEKYNMAINTSLGIASSYIVIDNELEASKCVKYLKEYNLGRATFFPLNTIEKRYIPNDIISNIKDNKDFIGIAGNLVHYDKKYENVILNQLGNVIVVTNIDSANEIAKKINYRYKIVTLDGNVINIGGSITGGSAINKAGILKDKYDLDNYNNQYRLLLDKLKKEEKQLNIYQNDEIKLDSEIYNLRNDYNLLNESIKNKNIELNKLMEEKEIINKDLKGINTVIDDNQLEEEEKLFLEIGKLSKLKDDIKNNIDILKLDKKNIEEDILYKEDSFRKNRSYINKCEKESKDLEILINRIEVKLDGLLVSLNEDYNMTFENAKSKYKLDIDIDLAREKVNNLKESLKGIGVVNIGAIDEFERINTRYQFLTKQKNDLNIATSTLLEIINEMDEVMKERFKTTFEDVRKEFRLVFRQLFKGGEADLKLTDKDNLLETGVEIIAQPPGKNLKSINVLSGGEQTFTAISLLFAVLNIKNVPFCIFDEIEAALDEVNVDSFGKYLDLYRDKTQFILITHKKKTMEYADTLYGITMQESGVSKLVSVRLEEINK